MKKLFLASPFYIKFHPNENSHVVSVVKRWAERNNISPLENSVKGVISDDYDDVKKKMIQNVIEYISQMPDAEDGKVKCSDFSVHYNITETDELDNVWTGRGVELSIRFE